MADSIYERLARVTAELGEITEALSTEVYFAIERETLKQVAIAAGVDHTTESTRVIEALGARLQREQDVNRELRRRIAAMERQREREDVSKALLAGEATDG